MSEPREHTLSVLLGDWRWFSDPARGTVVVLHRSGLWVEFCADLLWPDDGGEVWAQIAEAMSGAVAAGVTGQAFVVVTKHAADGGRYSATLERVAA